MSRPPLFAVSGSASTAGIVVSSHSGDRVVASSRRPDGTLRKEVKIRPGYTPEEDVQRYRSAHASKAGPVKKGIPGLVTAIVAPPSSSASSPGVSSSKSKAQKKNEKRKEKRKEENGELNAADASDSDEEGRGAGSKEKEEEVPESWDDGDEDDAEAAAATDPAPIVEQVTIVDPVDEAKRMKGLQKKLRQAEQLRDKVSDGTELNADQKAKVDGIAELEKELEALMLSAAST